MEEGDSQDLQDPSAPTALGIARQLPEEAPVVVGRPRAHEGAVEAGSPWPLEFSSAWPYLEVLPERLALFLARVTLDRSVLLGELPDSLWLLLLDRGLMKFTDLPSVKKARDLAKADTPAEESLRPDRYLAVDCRLVNSDSFLSFSPRANACRAHSWTWLEHLAARGPMSGWALAEALDEVFVEATTISAMKIAYANNPRRIPFTFAERCAVSGCSELQGPVSLDTSWTSQGHLPGSTGLVHASQFLPSLFGRCPSRTSRSRHGGSEATQTFRRKTPCF